MIRYIQYSKKKYHKRDSFDYSKKVSGDDFLSIYLQNPTEQEIGRICKDFDVEQRYFKKFQNEKRSLRYSFDPLIFTFTDYFSDSHNNIKTSHLLFILKNNVLIMAVYEQSNYYKELFDKIIDNAEKSRTKRIGFILYEFLHEDVKENYDVLEKMDDRLYAIEQKVINAGREDKTIMHDIIGIKRSMILMGKRLWASSKIIFTIKKDLTSIRFSREELILLDDIYDTLVHQIDLIETQKEMVTDLLNIFTTTISNRLAITSNELNAVMKKMAALTIIIMVPTLIAGIYGTNFHSLPEITWKYGYLYMWAFMIGAAGMTYLFFHKKNWV